MALANGIRFIWLDAHIGRAGDYEEFKKRFETTLEEAAAMPPDSINVLICALELNAAPFLFVHNPEDAIKLIETHHDKRIIFISSGTLGKDIIPHISANYHNVDRFYIFCGYIKMHLEWCIEYGSCLKMFDYETDLLVRLARDISNDIIKQGESYMGINDAKNALKCFEHSETLNIKANEIDNLNDKCFIYLRKLYGNDNNVGLIQRAKDMLNGKPQQQQEQQQQQQQTRGEEEENLSQEETFNN